jgi:hypothetical protein
MKNIILIALALTAHCVCGQTVIGVGASNVAGGAVTVATGNITGSGANTQVAYFTGAGTLSSNSHFTSDSSGNVATGNLTVGTGASNASTINGTVTVTRTAATGFLTASGNANAFGVTPAATGVSLGYNYSGGSGEANVMFGAASTAQYMAFQRWSGSVLTDVARIYGTGGFTLGGSSDPGAGSLQLNNVLGSGFTTASGNAGAAGYTPSNTGVSIGYNISNGNGEADLIFGAGSTAQWLSFVRWSGSANTEVARLYGTGGMTLGGTSDPGAGKLSLTGITMGSGTGTVTASSGVFSITSDRRAKNEHGVFVRGLSAITQLSPVKYDFKSDVRHVERVGFYTQDVEPFIPEAVFHDSPDGMASLDDRPITAALVNSVKELDARSPVDWWARGIAVLALIISVRTALKKK